MGDKKRDPVKSPPAKTLWRSVAKLVDRYRVTKGKDWKLSDIDPDDTGGLGAETKPAAAELLAQGTELLASEQDRLYAQNRRALLVIFQAMDAAGKDSTIKHVMSGVNPTGCQVWDFKQPNEAELDHDYLWRCIIKLPGRGQIGIFNRSYYEEVLIVRVHPKILDKQRLPPELVHDDIFQERLEDMRYFERYLTRNGISVLKFFLHVSRGEQSRRLLERLERPEKQWKFSSDDIRDRAEWKEYMRAYERAIRATATPDAPWLVVPADHKWFTRLIVAAAIVETLKKMDLRYPELDPAMKKELEAARRRLRSVR